MAKKLVPHKLVISFNDDGSFKDGIAMYRTKTDGVMDRGYKSVSIKNLGFSKPQLNSILIVIRDYIRTIEGIT